MADTIHSTESLRAFTICESQPFGTMEPEAFIDMAYSLATACAMATVEGCPNDKIAYSCFRGIAYLIALAQHDLAEIEANRERAYVAAGGLAA
jgi:hypothetical protein